MTRFKRNYLAATLASLVVAVCYSIGYFLGAYHVIGKPLPGILAIILLLLNFAAPGLLFAIPAILVGLLIEMITGLFFFLWKRQLVLALLWLAAFALGIIIGSWQPAQFIPPNSPYM